jgi:hypothetical protein
MPNENEGVLFKNEKKREGKKDPDYQGQLTVDGKEYWLVSWVNTSKDGTKKFMSIKAKLKEAKTESVETGAMPPENDSEEIPF